MQHSIDCDGYRYVHYAVTERHNGMSQARCEDCEWRGTLAGSDALSLVEQERRAHTTEVACQGECILTV